METLLTKTIKIEVVDFMPGRNNFPSIFHTNYVDARDVSSEFENENTVFVYRDIYLSEYLGYWTRQGDGWLFKYDGETRETSETTQ